MLVSGTYILIMKALSARSLHVQ